MSQRNTLVSLCLFLIYFMNSPLVVRADEFGVNQENQTLARPISPPSYNSEASADSQAGSGSFVTTLGALGLILMIFLGLVQMWKKRTPHLSGKLPHEVWQELGSTRLDHRYQVRLVRVGSRILILGQSDTNLQTLSEITGSEEVANLVAQCGPNADNGEKSKFHSLYEQFCSRIDSSGTTHSPTASLSSRGGS